MTQQRILVIFGTRPEAIKLFPVVQSLAQLPAMQVKTCVTAQHRGLLDQVLEIAQLVPDHDLNLMTQNQSLSELTSKILVGVGNVLDQESIDRVIVQGDTATAMAGSLAAYYRKIPVAHVEAGLRSGDIYNPWPEEINRRLIAPIADLHFAPTKTAEDALLNEGITRGVFVTGNTVIDALNATLRELSKKPEMRIRADEIVSLSKGKKIVLVTTHRRENFGDGIRQIASAINTLSNQDNISIVFPVHPNPAVTEPIRNYLKGRDNVHLIEPLDYPNFVSLLAASYFVLTDSGGVQEEAPALGKPVLVMRETTERPEGIKSGTAKLVGTKAKEIIAASFELLNNEISYKEMAYAHNPFGDGKASARIAKIISAGSPS